MIYGYKNGTRVPIEITDDPDAKAEAEQNVPTDAPTIEERVAAVETDVDDLTYILTGKERNHAQ